MAKVTGYVSLSLNERIKTQKERIASFSNTIKINRDAVFSDYEELKEKVRKEELYKEENNKEVDKAKAINKQKINNSSLTLHDVTYKLTLGRKVIYSNNDFFLKSGLKKPNQGEYYRLSFSEEFNNCFIEGMIIRIKAKIEYKIFTKNFKEVHELTFHFIDDIEIEYPSSNEKVTKISEKIYQLETNNWERLVTPAERKEQNEEISKIKIDIENISNRELKNIDISSKIAPVLKKIENLNKRFSALNIRPNSLFPSSMSFIQNPNYQGVHKLYKEIQSLSGVDEKLFMGLEKVENIGILNISLIYERWCLLQIIKILIDKFRFLPEQNWKDSLLNQIVNSEPSKVRDVKISLENKDTCRKITLCYEKELPIDEGRKFPRRADFVIDLVSDIDPNQIISKRIVLDAKFYENIDEMGGISKVINSLYNEKNYSSSGKNQVFILHPSPKAVPATKTPQKWAKDSFLGESSMFAWDDSFPNHRYGAVLLSPVGSKGDYLESLQMCIGLSLQYKLEDNSLKNEGFNDWINSQSNIHKATGINPLPKGKVFCLICGGSDLRYKVEQPGKNGLRWTLVCNDCTHITLYNYCWSCRNRLIKHGIYWTYHATQSLQPFNIKCPSCGEIVS